MTARVLIIDREPYFRKLAREELEDRGFVVHEGDEGALVEELLCSYDPDLVLLDLHTHRGKGWRVLRELKQSRPDLPVLIFTAHDSFSDDPRFLLADGLVIKSIHFEELEGEVKKVLPYRTYPKEESEPELFRFAVLTIGGSQEYVF